MEDSVFVSIKERVWEEENGDKIKETITEIEEEYEMEYEYNYNDEI